MHLDAHFALLDERERILLEAREQIRLVLDRAGAERRPLDREALVEEHAKVGLVDNRSRQEGEVHHRAVAAEQGDVARKVVLAHKVDNEVDAVGVLLRLGLKVLRAVVDDVQARVVAAELLEEGDLFVRAAGREDLVGAADVDCAVSDGLGGTVWDLRASWIAATPTPEAPCR